MLVCVDTFLLLLFHIEFVLNFCINCKIIADDANKDKCNDLAKSVCKLEHGFMLGHDIVKEAAKQTTVESFDQVMCRTFSINFFVCLIYTYYHVSLLVIGAGRFTK